MARQIRWTLAAVEDLDQAAEYVAKNSAAYAATLVDRALKVVRSLKSSPERGAIVDELRDEGIRERYVDGFRLIYAIRSEVVHVLAFIHAARDFRTAWSEKKRSF